MRGRLVLQILLFLLVPLSACAEDASAARPADAPATAPETTPEAKPAEAGPAPATATAREARDEIRRLIFDFTSDDWQKRENAVARVVAHDQAAMPELEAVIKKSDDPEVIVRARKAVIAIREAPIRGTFTQTDAKVTDGQGNVRDGDTKDGYLVVGDGQVTWYQHFGGTMTMQTYSYDISRRLEWPQNDQLDVPLTYVSIETEIGYSPESHDPKLQFRKTASGELKISFGGTDGMGQRMKADFVKKDKSREQDPDRK